MRYLLAGAFIASWLWVAYRCAQVLIVEYQWRMGVY